MKRFAACLMSIAAVGAVADVIVVSSPIAAAQEKPGGKPDDKTPPKKDEKKAEAGAWMDSYAKALEAAKKDKKVVLAAFVASDAESSKKLHSEIFESKEFGEWAKKNAVLLEVDTAKGKKLPDDVKKQNEDLVAKNKVTSFPTVLFFNEKGEVAGKIDGYKAGTKPEAWIKEATDQLAKAKH